MKVLLIRTPNLLPAGIGQAGATCPPLGPAYLAASLRAAGHEVVGIDAVGAAPMRLAPFSRPGILIRGIESDEIAAMAGRTAADVVGFSIMFTHEWPEARRTIELVRRALPRAVLLAGGEHITAAPELSLRDCPDLQYCALGEGEETIVDFVAALAAGGPPDRVAGLAYLRDGRLHRTGPRSRIRDIDRIPVPDWNAFPVGPYLDNNLSYGVGNKRSMPILATRGCPFQCTFCSSPFMWGTRWQARSPDGVLDEMQHYMAVYGAENFDFYDLTAIVKREWILDFCRRLLDRGMVCTWQLPSGTRSEAIDDEVVDLLHRSGCRNISYAPESGSPRMLRRIKKKVKLPRMIQSMHSAVRRGLNVKANILIGFPGETHGDAWRSLAFICRLARVGIHDIHFQGYTPYPGAEMYDELQTAGRLPPVTDDYCYSLVEANAGVTDGVSYSEHLNSRWIGAYRFLGLSAFYFLRYVLRPSALARMIRNVRHGISESRGEQALISYLQRRSAGRLAEGSH